MDQDEVKVKNKKKQTNKQKQHVEASISRSNDTENYSPCWEGWFVEVAKTAVDIRAGSDEDASVKERAR